MIFTRLLCLMLLPLIALNGAGLAADATVLCVSSAHVRVEPIHSGGACGEAVDGAAAHVDWHADPHPPQHAGVSGLAPRSACVDVVLPAIEQNLSRRSIENKSNLFHFTCLPHGLCTASVSGAAAAMALGDGGAGIVHGGLPPAHLVALRTCILLT